MRRCHFFIFYLCICSRILNISLIDIYFLALALGANLTLDRGAPSHAWGRVWGALEGQEDGIESADVECNVLESGKLGQEVGAEEGVEACTRACAWWELHHRGCIQSWQERLRWSPCSFFGAVGYPLRVGRHKGRQV